MGGEIIIKIKYFLEVIVIFLIAHSLVLPSVAILNNNDVIEFIDTFWAGKKKIEVDKVLKWDQNQKALPINFDSNIQITGWADGDSRRPSITRDSQGNVFITYQFDEDLFSSSAGFAYNSNPLDQQAWWDNGIVLTISGIEIIYYPDTALCEHPDYELMNVFVAIDSEEVGGMYLPDVTNYETWEIFTWTSGAPEPELAQISDGGWYHDKYYEDVIGPFNFYIYHEIYDVYNIKSCPIFFHNGIDSASGVGYFDGQSEEITAPAADPDYVNLPNKIHTSIYNIDTEKIIWKKLDPSIETDYEFTPFQATVAEGTNPTIAAYDDKVAIIYHENGQIKCVYSYDDGENWESPVTIGPGQFPDAYAQGSIIYAAYVNDGNLYIVSSQDGGTTWSTPTKKNDQDGTVVAEENCVDVHSAGIVWVDDRDGKYNIYYTTLVGGPNPPIITGPSSGKVNRYQDFTVTTIDPAGSDVWYFIDWGDDTNSGWLGPYHSGIGTTESHKWTEEAAFTIRAKVKNKDDIESDWSTFAFNAPKRKLISLEFLDELPIFRYLFNKWFL